jgi:hypothetical protein
MRPCQAARREQLQELQEADRDRETDDPDTHHRRGPQHARHEQRQHDDRGAEPTREIAEAPRGRGRRGVRHAVAGGVMPP